MATATIPRTGLNLADTFRKDADRFYATNDLLRGPVDDNTYNWSHLVRLARTTHEGDREFDPTRRYVVVNGICLGWVFRNSLGTWTNYKSFRFDSCTGRRLGESAATRAEAVSELVASHAIRGLGA